MGGSVHDWCSLKGLSAFTVKLLTSDREVDKETEAAFSDIKLVWPPTMKFWISLLLIVALTWLVFAQRGRNRLITSSRVSSKTKGGCDYQGTRVCNGAIVQTFRLSSFVRVCEKGKLKVKRTRDITNAQKRISERTLGKRDCTWYGEAYCHGDEVIDLYRWWFKMVCSDGNMRIQPRRWREVVRDPRYELTQG